MRWPGNTQLVPGAILAPGDRLGGYRIVSHSGSGDPGREPRGLATAAVLYHATEVSSGLPVMLTVFKREHSSDEPFAQRLVRDGKRVASFTHPNVLAVYEAGLEHGRLFLVTQAIDGDTLRERLAGGGIPAAQALALLAPIADALDAAHAAGLVHGELTPDAVRVDTAGTPRLAALDVPVRVSGLGVEGVRLGDIGYASPESLGGQQLTAASDIYSLAAVLCHCLTGETRVPEQTDSRAERQQARARRAHRLGPGAPVLADVIARGMAKAPADRYEQARSLIEDAAKAVASASWGPSRSSPEPVAPWRRVAFGLFCAGVIAAGVLEAETRSNTGPVSVPRKAQSARSVSDGPLGIRYRPPWRAAPGTVPGAFAVVGSPGQAPILLSSGPATLAAGPLARSSPVPGGAPPQLVLRYGPASAAAASIAGHAASRYDWTLPGGRSLVGFVLASAGSDLALICSATVRAQRSLAACQQLAGAATVSGVTVLAPGPDRALAAALDQDLGPLDVARGLGVAPLPARAAAASHLARLALAASSLLARLAPPERSARAIGALRHALIAQAAALTDLAGAAVDNDRGAYLRARELDLSGGVALRAPLRSLAAEGLHPPALHALEAVPPAPAPAASASSGAASGQTATAPAIEAPSPAAVAAPPPAASPPAVVPAPAPTSSSSGPPSPTVIVVPTQTGASKQSATSPSMVVVVPTN